MEKRGESYEFKLSENEFELLTKETNAIVSKLKESIKSLGINADVFIGGSLAKRTVVKKKKQDVDIFVRFHEKEGLSDKLEGILAKANIPAIRVHGSRDYFYFEARGVVFEIIPTLKISNPKNAKNITDLSYFHVKYIKNKIEKNKKLADEIVKAKAFCYAQGCYGAESYIKGLSGYALEVLVTHYKSFSSLLRAIIKINIKKGDKLIIDPEKHYKNSGEILRELNEAKLHSPIIAIDPTFNERNVAASLSFETFIKMQKTAKAFLNKPSQSFFEANKITAEGLKREAKAKKAEFLAVELKTDKQAGDIAGTKLLKFYNFLAIQIENYFTLLKKGFEYDDKQRAETYFILKEKKMIFPGPPLKMKGAIESFRKAHRGRKTFTKGGKIYAEGKPITIKSLVKIVSKENRKIIKEMGITSFKEVI